MKTTIEAGGVMQLMVEACKLRDEGATEEEVQAFLDTALGVCPLDKMPRYNCAQCQDMGRVLVWGHLPMKAVLEEQEVPKSYRTGIARCNKCDKGKPRGKVPKDCEQGYNGPVENTPEFNPSWMLLVRNNDTTSRRALDRLNEWVEELKLSAKSKQAELF